jgi:hypothetical protein
MFSLSTQPEIDAINYAASEFFAVVCDHDYTVKVFDDTRFAEQYAKPGHRCPGNHFVLGVTAETGIERTCFRNARFRTLYFGGHTHGDCVLMDSVISLVMTCANSAYNATEDTFAPLNQVTNFVYEVSHNG